MCLEQKSFCLQGPRCLPECAAYSLDPIIYWLLHGCCKQVDNDKLKVVTWDPAADQACKIQAQALKTDDCCEAAAEEAVADADVALWCAEAMLGLQTPSAQMLPCSVRALCSTS